MQVLGCLKKLGLMSARRPPSVVGGTKEEGCQSMVTLGGRTPSSRSVTNGKSSSRRRHAEISVDDVTCSFSALSVSTRPKFFGKKIVPKAQQTRRFTLGCKSTVEDVCRALGSGQLRHVILLVGAGISTASGIPDFRSPGSGLYDNLKKYDIPYAEAIFDITFFRRQPRPFLVLAKELYPGNYKPNLVHNFLSMLSEKGVLRRVYTQNIDGMERLAGVPDELIVEAHGTFATASCVRCRRLEDPAKVRQLIFNGQIPRCQRCDGLVKPDIVFFGENLPERFYALQSADFRLCDLLVVMGTSLEVEPFCGLVDFVRSTTPRILLNRDLVGPFRTKRKVHRAGPDLALQGDLLAGVRRFSELCGWSEHLKEAEEKFSASWLSPQHEAVKSSPEAKMAPSEGNAGKAAEHKHSASAAQNTDSSKIDSSSSSLSSTSSVESGSSSPRSTSSSLASQ